MIELALSYKGDLTSAFTTALTGRAIDVVAGRTDDVHPNTAVASAWRKVSRSATILLGELRRAEARTLGGESPEPAGLQAGLKAFLYDVTETFDLYQQAIPKRLEQGRSKREAQAIGEYRTSGKRLRDPVALMCNKLKHDHREIGSCLIRSMNAPSSTWVFRIAAAYGTLQTADREVHRKSGFISYERILHELIHGLLRIDQNAGLLVRGLSDNAPAPVALRGATALGLADVLADLGCRKPTCASAEPGRIDGVERSGQVIRLRKIEVVHVPEPTQRIMSATVDEVALSVQMFI